MERFEHRKSLGKYRARCMSWLILLFMATGLVAGGVLFYSFHYTAEKRVQEKGQAIANHLAKEGRAVLQNSDALSKWVNEAGRKINGSQIMILTNDGKVLAHTDESEVGRMLADPLTERSLQQATETNVFRYEQNSETYYNIVAPIPDEVDLGRNLGIVRVILPTRNIQDGFPSFLSIALILLAVVAVMSGVAGLVCAKLLFSPLDQSLDTFVQIAGGDLRQSMGVHFGGTEGSNRFFVNMLSDVTTGLRVPMKKVQDTVQPLLAQSEWMISNIKNVHEGSQLQSDVMQHAYTALTQINAVIHKLSEELNGLSEWATRVSSSLEGPRTAIQGITEGLGTLSLLAEDETAVQSQMVTSVKKMAEQVHVLSRMTVEAVTTMNAANASTQETRKSVMESALLTEAVFQLASDLETGEKTIAEMGKIKTITEESFHRMTQLNGQTEQVEKVLMTIGDVTRQTHLLAINATILATQAGEEEKGFLMVIEEMKRLSDRTTSSVKELAQIVVVMQSDVQAVISLLRGGKVSVNEGMRLSIGTKGASKQILEQAQRTFVFTSDIQKATAEQVVAIGQISEVVNKMDLLVQGMDAFARADMALLDRMTKGVEKIRDLTGQVAEVMRNQVKEGGPTHHEMEGLAERLSQVGVGMNEQKEAIGMMTGQAAEARRIEQVISKTIQQMTGVVEGFKQQTEILKESVEQFQL